MSNLDEPTERFELLEDLGTITVPDDYVHKKRLDLFGRENYEEFRDYNKNITDANFPKPSRVLKARDKLRILAFRQIVPGTTTSDERMAFLVAQKAVHTGAQGVSLVLEQRRERLPKGYWCASFDKKSALWEDANGDHWVPGVGVYSAGGFGFGLGHFECLWSFRGHAFLCFCDTK